MKHKLQTLLKHNWRTILLLLTLVTICQEASARYRLRGDFNSWGCTEVGGTDNSAIIYKSANGGIKVSQDCNWNVNWGKDNSSITTGSLALESGKANVNWTAASGMYGVKFDGSTLYIYNFTMKCATSGNQGTKYLGDYVGAGSSGDWKFYFGIGNKDYGTVQAVVFKAANTPIYTVDASYNKDDGDNKEVVANLKGKQFTSTGKWYVKGRAKAFNNDTYGYTNGTDYVAVVTSLNANNNGAAYWTVNALPDPTSQSSSASGTTATVSWTHNNTYTTVMVVRYEGASPTVTAPTGGTSYSSGSTIGAGTVIYNGTSGSKSDTGRTAGTTYTYYLYTVNNNYYSSGVSTSVTIPSACTGPTVVTSSTSTPSYATATVSGTITNGSCTVNEAGICYALSTVTTTPTISNSTKTVSYTSGTEFSTSLSGLTPGKTYYYRAYATTDSETKYGTVQSFSTTACSNPTISDSSQPSADNVSYCKNATATALTVTATGGVGSYTYQWQQRTKTTDDWANATAGTGSTTASFIPSTSYYDGTSFENKYYRCVVTNKDVCTSNSVNSNSSGRIRTYAPTTAGSISDAGTFCQGEVGDVQTLTLSGQNATANVRWYVSSTSGFTPGTSTRTEVTATTYDAPISSTGTLYYKVNVKNGACATVTTDQAAVTVDPYPAITAQPTASQSVCVGSTASSISVTATGTGLSYQWQWKSGENWVDWADKTSSTLTFTGAIPYANTWHYRCKITASCGATIYSNTHTLTGVDTASITSVTLTSSPVCKGQGLGATANDVVLGGGTGAWSSSNTSVATVNSSETTTTTVATPGAGTANIIYTITGGCGGTKSAQAALKVKATATAAQYTLTNNDQTYNGSARAVTVTPASGAGAATVYYTGTGSTTYTTSTTAPTNAGSYSITIDAADGDDYCAATNLSLGTLTINKANQSTLTISNTATDFVYCDAANVKLTTSGGSGDGAVTYTVTSGSGSVDGDVLSPSAKGSVSVTATKAASTNYNATTSAAKTFNFNINAPNVYELSNVGGATTICGDPSSGAGSGTLRLANSQTGYKYQLYSNGAPIEGYAAKAGTTGSSIDFPVTSSGTYTVYAYYGDNSTNCPTRMNGEITLTISTQPRLVRSAASVTQYMPVTITSVSTDIAEWKITDNTGTPDLSSSTAYLYDKTYDAISFKGASTNGSTAKTYTIQATTAGGCSEKTTITVNPDTEACN